MPPKQGNYSATGDHGVHAVAEIVYDRLGWILRPQTEADVGIDGEIEVVERGNALGQLLKVQIKAGPSWFSEQTSDAFVFRASDRHFRYWLDHCLPVLVVLYDRRKRQAFWGCVSENKARRTGDDWKLAIPFRQKLNRNAKSVLKLIAAGGARRTAQLLQVADAINATLWDEFPPTSFNPVLAAVKTARKSVRVITPFITAHGLREFASVLNVPARIVVGNPQTIGSPSEMKQMASQTNAELRVAVSEVPIQTKAIVIDEFLCLFPPGNVTALGIRAGQREPCVAVTDARSVSAILKMHWHLWNSAFPITALLDRRA